ncbi:16S rRNA (guanine(966)-N(2))-methyltransferase RsmD [Methylorubrum extorquens]|uniref:Methyltransferase with SAM-dependent methyltransferase domain n=1 Tax=Methylorubrum extorquens (strain ATCC 14718 / DSM 1338 / JCM 2805 / NCIMB 9133 / AM1) TaxID=272630 RepID=C5B253_METEA|nr:MULTISPECIES: 16S rRNA (guanine(966)-N(2))-methyltransferase RsmD [Methylorubrum]ACS41870.1 putative methyltransferase with SAM-dependent methyltransferase domain [Methylorubrum extorquens AM1]MCP1545084.1 16S rRNA (guanine966-N2)-methyltransferase [Methylorubrum extorquens]MCP1587569.1 16S rRNA (guanine966-N2)-methyltransferase [Methylorubrum extorquens]BDL41256.1 DNA methyltransferase [Methylorubrum sp. GM97]
MRIVGGEWRGRRLVGPKAEGIRPTSDRLREALFNVLAHAYDDAVEDAVVLDLFAGTGALGFEALSRGAARALFVDEGRQAGTLIRAAIAALGCEDRARLIPRDATRLGPALDRPATLVFCDPPYRKNLAPAALTAAAGGGWLSPGALVLVEEAAEAGAVLPPGFEELERRSYGETTVTFGRFAG